jgi:hypothetical protein
MGTFQMAGIDQPTPASAKGGKKSAKGGKVG